MVATALAALITVIAMGNSAMAVHESTNTLVFEAVRGGGSPEAAGAGVIEYRGGEVLDSRWTVQLQFRGLTPGALYVAVIQGRYGATGSPEADVFSPLCTLVASPAGEGGCWWYLVRMEHLDVVQLRIGSVDGAAVVQATRKGDGPGSIASVPNAFSPLEAAPVASPVGSPSPLASPSQG